MCFGGFFAGFGRGFSVFGLTRTAPWGYSYYEGGVSSVYFWDLDDGFAGVVLLKKSKMF